MRAVLRFLVGLASAYFALSLVRCFAGLDVRRTAAESTRFAGDAGRVSRRSPWRRLQRSATETVELIEVNVKKEPKVGSALDNSEIVKRAKREALPLIASTPVENRKLRAAIESIELDQEALRVSSPLFSLKTFLATSSAATVSMVASLLSSSPTLFILMPSLTTVIFLYSSLSESAAARYKANAKYNYGQNSKLAATAETSLAIAESRKVFFPFGVGLTAITAAACVTLRIFNEKIGDFIPEGQSFSTILAGDNVVLILFALASMVGATLTSLTYVSTRAALVLDESIQASAQSDWEATRLPKRAKEPTPEEERNIVIATVIFCLLPVPFIVEGIDMSLAETNRMLFNKALQQLLDDASVVISASAAAQAAVAFLLGERDFTDAEQRCAMQSKQAALAEMFCAQAQQEAAIIPVRSAFSAAARGGADLAIEFSKLAAAIFPWGAVGQAFQSILNARLVRVESDAAINEARIVKYGPKLTRNRNAIDASLIEFGRLQKEVFPSDNEIRDEIAALKVGEVKDFKIRSKEGRREVHLIAAELGMVSRSYTSGNQRVVSVKNTGGALDSNEEQTSFVDMVEKEFVGTLQKEAETSLAEGIPKEWMPWVSTAAAATVSAQAAPAVLGADASQVVLPLVTGGIGLLTVWQERAGREQVAYAKKDAAVLQRRHAEAEALVGLAALSASALPTYVAVSAVASAFSCVGFLADFGVVAWACELPTLLLSTLCLILGLERQEQVEKYVRGASRIIGGEPPKRARFRAQRLWLLLPWIVMFLPETLVRRCCAANALIVAEIGFVIANCGRQLSFAEFYTARTRRVHSRTDAWAQIASACSRSLPLTSALALTNTLVATTLGAVNVSFGGLFPIFGLGVCIRAIQKAVESRESAIITSQEGRDAQTLGENFPPYPQLGRQEEMPTEDPRSLRADLKQLSKASFRSGVSRLSRGFLRLFEDTKPEQAFNQTSDQKVVRRVQADLEELRVTVRGNDPNWARVGSVVGILTAASVIAPFLLSELLTEVIVPLAGTTLTIFVVIAESEARSSVAQAKVHAAQINEQMSTMEELVSITSLWKAYLLGMVGVADCNAILGLVLKTPWNVISLYPKLQALQEVAQFALAFASIATCALAARRLLQVREWAASVKKIAADNFNEDTLRGITQTSPVAVDTGGGHLPISKFQRCVVIGAAVLPSILFMVLPLPGREELAEKVVGCTGAAALVVALLMLQAERASCKAERIQASCKRAASLCEAFANRAEQQGALLPFNSAAAIAVAGVITFLTELNPGTAAALTILQAMSWLIASRKGVATKFESRASLQVRSRFSMRGVMAATGSLGMRVKSILIG